MCDLKLIINAVFLIHTYQYTLTLLKAICFLCFISFMHFSKTSMTTTINIAAKQIRQINCRSKGVYTFYFEGWGEIATKRTKNPPHFFYIWKWKGGRNINPLAYLFYVMLIQPGIISLNFFHNKLRERLFLLLFLHPWKWKNLVFSVLHYIF